MIENVKALIVVLTIATAVLALGWRLALGLIAREDLVRRVACWYTLTLAAFLSPSFWLYAAVAAPLIAWAARRDTNPLGLYAIVFFVIPPLQIEIPTAGLLNLFYLDNGRLLGFVILLPLALRAMATKPHLAKPGAPAVETLLWLFGALQIVQFFPYETGTNTMRRTFLFLLDIALIYYAFSRGLKSREQFDDTFASFTLAAGVLATLGAFESLRHWLLYTQIGNLWGATNEFAWLFRGDRLRAQVSTGHALSLGYMLAMALGFWMYLKSHSAGRLGKLGVAAIFCAGIYFTYSRGPMLTAAFAVMTYSVLGQRSPKRALISLAALGGAAALFLWSPLGSGIAETLPFVGSDAQDTIDYRQQLATVSWELVQKNPWFGDPFVLLNMEALRQGQGIIDLVNAYASVALFHGLVGLALFVGAFAAGLQAAYVRFRTFDVSSPGEHSMREVGAVLIAAMLATMLFMGTAGNAWLQWQLLGMLSAYATLAVPLHSHTQEAAPHHAALRQRIRYPTA